MSNDELDEVITSIKQRYHSAGERMIIGHLKAKNIHVQRHRIRQSIRRVDDNGVNARSLTTIQRQKYSVPSPNYLWHIDGTHKLVRWRLVIHVGVDGFSRLIVYCKCCPSNKASTVLELFKEAKRKYGLPLKIRSDYGGENVEVWKYMYRKHLNLDAVILGSSVHNQRIERLNRDVNTQVVNYYVNLFAFMEQRNILNPDCEINLFALHCTFLPLINDKLLEFTRAWNNHPISTAENSTPCQLHAINLRLLQLQALDASLSISANDIAIPQVSVVDFAQPRAILFPDELQRTQELIALNSHLKPIRLFKLVVEFISNVISSRNFQLPLDH